MNLEIEPNDFDQNPVVERPNLREELAQLRGSDRLLLPNQLLVELFDLPLETLDLDCALGIETRRGSVQALCETLEPLIQILECL